MNLMYFFNIICTLLLVAVYTVKEVLGKFVTPRIDFVNCVYVWICECIRVNKFYDPFDAFWCKCLF